LIIDYHLHTPYCGHAQGKTVQYIERAIALGMSEICFTDHLGRYYLTHVQRRRYWDWGMDERTIPRYVAELVELRELFSDKISIKIGLEIDFIEGADELLAPFLTYHPFDFLLGSIHCLPKFGWKHLADFKEYSEERIFREYFRYARAALHSGYFHSLAHLDFIWRYIRWPRHEPFSFLEREIAETVKTVQETDRCIEINANGYLWSQTNHRESIDPYIILLGEIKNQHVPITIGSDAHDPLLVGKAYGDIIPLLHGWGITQCAVFTGGRRSLVPLG
jgi:histidinol-phosphatase (PHP family)